MLQKLYRLSLRLRGYRPEWRHPLEVHKPRPGRDPEQIKRRVHRQALLQAHIAYHRERLDDTEQLKAEGRALAAELEMVRLQEREAERRLDSVIEACWLAVDAAFYRAGLA